MNWFPRSTRNRVALLLFVISLSCFVAWNFIPRYDRYEGINEGYLYQYIWLDFWKIIKHTLNGGGGIDVYISTLMMIVIVLAVTTCMFFFVAWRQVGLSRLLCRFPAALFIGTSCFAFYYLCGLWRHRGDNEVKELYYLFIFMFLQLFFAGIALLLLRTQSEPQEEIVDDIGND